MTLKAEHLSKTIGDTGTKILHDISFVVPDGQFMALTGPSGSGKSTLLYAISSLDSISEGKVIVDGQDLSQLRKKELALFRNHKIGFVFQFHYLIAELTVLENVLLPAKKNGEEKRHRALAEDLIHQIGLSDKKNRLPRQLSGGEEQRIAIARSLIMQPKYVFADEPTGSLDSNNGEVVMNMLKNANKQQGTTIILVTHDSHFADQAQRRIHLVDGKVVSDSELPPGIQK